MNTKILLSIIVIAIILSYGCKDKSKEEIVTPNTEPIEYLSFEDKGCQSASLKEYPIFENEESRQLQILKKKSEIESNYWDYVGDSLIISTTFIAQCYAAIRDSVLLTESKIEIYLRDKATRSAKCSCTIEEELKFKAESPKTIEIIIYFKSFGSEKFIVIGHSTIKI
jgi:hypothetical protein